MTISFTWLTHLICIYDIFIHYFLCPWKLRYSVWKKGDTAVTQKRQRKTVDLWIYPHFTHRKGWETVINQWQSLDPSSCCEIPFSVKRSQGFLGKWLILGLGQESTRWIWNILACQIARMLSKIARVMIKGFCNQFRKTLLAKDETN